MPTERKDVPAWLPPPPPVRLNNRQAPITMTTSRKALAKVSSIAHTTKDFAGPKIQSSITSIRNYSNSSGTWKDEPGVITTPKKVQKGKQSQIEGDYGMFGGERGLPSPSASKWSGIGSYFSSAGSSSSASMSGSSSSATLRPQDFEEEKIVLFPGVS